MVIHIGPTNVKNQRAGGMVHSVVAARDDLRLVERFIQSQILGKDQVLSRFGKAILGQPVDQFIHLRLGQLL